MGGVTLWMAASGESMLSTGGWEANFAADLNHYGHVIDDALAGIPSLAVALVLVIVAALLVSKAGAEIGWWGRNTPKTAKTTKSPKAIPTTAVDKKIQDAKIE
jgi:hypothetical protein